MLIDEKLISKVLFSGQLCLQKNAFVGNCYISLLPILLLNLLLDNKPSYVS